MRTAVSFGDGAPSPELDAAELTRLLGGKAAGLVSLSAKGFPVPAGFTLPTTLCHEVIDEGWSPELDATIEAGLAEIGERLGRRLGDLEAPLLVSVRSGAPISMPGMMDTVLNAGITPEIAGRLSARHGDPCFGWDTFARFVRGYATVVGRVPRSLLDETLPADAENGPDAVLASIERLAEAGCVVPEDPLAQVTGAAQAVFESWNSDRARIYRAKEAISDHWGTAVTVQAMVFGNRGPASGSGVVFSRNPATGEPSLTGDFLPNAQGEDLVSGTQTAWPISDMSELWPDVAHKLAETARKLEYQHADMLDIEFTVEDGALWLLQCRTGKRHDKAALRIAVAMAEDPDFPLDRASAVERVAHLLDTPPTTETGAPEPDPADIIATGMAASPGRATGVVSTGLDDTIERAVVGESVILIRPETSPADVAGLAEAAGLVTSTGSMTCHAAVVAREWGLPAVVGAGELTIADTGVSGPSLQAPTGTVVTVDGDHGTLLLGAHPVQGAAIPEFEILREWRDDHEAKAIAPSASRSTVPVQQHELLRWLSIKGMATADAAAGHFGSDRRAIDQLMVELVANELLAPAPGDRYRLAPAGTEAARAHYRAEADATMSFIEPSMNRFQELNTELKQIVTSWQMREIGGESIPNDHRDHDYDHAILCLLADQIHPAIARLLDDISIALPRLANYKNRFATALAGIQGGNHSLVAHPLEDSYHTIWFELHEDLIRLTGRTRADEDA